jgi:diguanylate cyclase (GGDEF)-like protein/PAS domain S-box-containing protein
MSSRLEREFTEQLIDSIAIPMFAIDTQHLITHWNKAIEHASGFSKKSMLGTNQQWRPFYEKERTTMADIIVDGSVESSVKKFYTNKYRPSNVLKNAFEAEDYFPAMGKGEWLSFTAAPIVDSHNNMLGAVETLTVISDRKNTEFELKKRTEDYRQSSIQDDLTKLYNARHFFKTLPTEMARCDRYNEPLTLCMLDLDGFKHINDKHGHLLGNTILEAFGEIITKSIRSIDFGFRYGGEEFVIILPASDEQSAFNVAERIRSTLADQHFLTDEGQKVAATVSAGITRYRQGESERELLTRVDQTMYRAKKDGRNRVAIYSSAA